ncbi:MAG: hypothetical protein ACTSYI_08775 [Promethearchaeota archaeon]
MKRTKQQWTIGLLFLLSVSMFLGDVAPARAEDLAYEPNDTPEEAWDVELGADYFWSYVDTGIEHRSYDYYNLSTAEGDQDWFKIWAPEGSSINFDVPFMTPDSAGYTIWREEAEALIELYYDVYPSAFDDVSPYDTWYYINFSSYVGGPESFFDVFISIDLPLPPQTIIIEQPDYLEYYEGDELWCRWNVYLSDDLTPDFYDLVIDGTTELSEPYLNGAYIEYNIADYGYGVGIHEVTLIVYTLEDIIQECTILVEVVAQTGITILQPDWLTYMVGDSMLCWWEIQIPYDHIPEVYYIYVDGAQVDEGPFVDYGMIEFDVGEFCPVEGLYEVMIEVHTDIDWENCSIWVEVIPFDDYIYIYQPDYLSYYMGDYMEVWWEILLPPGYTPEFFEIYLNDEPIEWGEYMDGAIIIYDLTGWIGGPGYYYVTIVVYTVEGLSGTCTILVEVFDYYDEPWIEQPDYLEFYMSDWKELMWIPHLPDGYSPNIYQISLDGVVLMEGPYADGMPLTLEVSPWIDGPGYYEFWCMIDYNDPVGIPYGIECSILVYIYEDYIEPWLEQPDYVEFFIEDWKELTWIPHLTVDYVPDLCEIYLYGDLIYNGPYASELPINLEISPWIGGPGYYEFTCVIYYFDEFDNYYAVECMILVYVREDYQEVWLEQPDYMEFFMSDEKWLEWIPHLPGDYYADFYEISFFDILVASGPYADGQPINLEVSPWIDGFGYFEFMCRIYYFDPTGNQLWVDCIIVVYIQEDIYDVWINQWEYVQYFLYNPMEVWWECYLVDGFVPLSYELYMNEELIDGGIYGSGWLISYDVSPWIMEAGFYYFRMEFLYLNAEGVELLAECTILVEVLPEIVDIYIEQVDSMWFYEYDYMELKWTCFLPPDYMADYFELYMDNILVDGGYYLSGDPVYYDISYLIPGPGYYAFTMVFYSFNELDEYIAAECTIFVEVRSQNAEIWIEQPDVLTYWVGDYQEAYWTCFLPADYNEMTWELYFDGAFWDSGFYCNGLTIFYDFTYMDLLPGIYSFMMRFYAEMADGTIVWAECTIIIEILGQINEVWIEQPDVLYYYFGDIIEVGPWICYLPEEFEPMGYELYMDDVLQDMGYYHSGLPIAYDVTELIYEPGVYFFTMMFWYFDPTHGETWAECTIRVEVWESLDWMYIEQPDWLGYQMGDYMEAWWICYLPDSWEAMEYELYMDGVFVDMGPYVSGMPIYHDITPFITGPGYYAFTMGFWANNGVEDVYDECTIMIEVWDSYDEMYIDQPEYLVYTMDSYAELWWTCYLPPDYSPNIAELYLDGDLVNYGYYYGGETVFVDAMLYVAGPGIYYFTMVFYAFDLAGNLVAVECTIVVEIREGYDQPYIEQPDYLSFHLGQAMWAEWVCFLPEGYYDGIWEIYMDGEPFDYGFYERGYPVDYDLAMIIPGAGLYEFTMRFYYYNEFDEEYWIECTIVVEVFEELEEVWIEQPDWLYFMLGDYIELKWIAYLPANYYELQYEIYMDGTNITKGYYSSEYPVEFDATPWITSGGIFAFEIFFYYELDYETYWSSCVIMVEIWDRPEEIVIEQPDTMAFEFGDRIKLPWTAFLPDGHVADYWDLYMDGVHVDTGHYADGYLVEYDATDLILGSGFYEFTMVFYTREGLTGECTILVEILEAPNTIVIRQPDYVVFDIQRQMLLGWTVFLPEGEFPSYWTLLRDGYEVADGGFESGEYFEVDIRPFISMEGQYDFTIVITTESGLEESCLTVVDVFDPENGWLEIDQISEISITLFDTLTLDWTCYVSPGFETSDWRLYVDGTLVDYGTYSDGISVEYDVSSFLTATGSYEFTMRFTAYYEGYMIENECTITVTVVDAEPTDDTTDDEPTDDTTDDEPTDDDGGQFGGIPGFGLGYLWLAMIGTMVVVLLKKSKWKTS